MNEPAAGGSSPAQGSRARGARSFGGTCTAAAVARLVKALGHAARGSSKTNAGRAAADHVDDPCATGQGGNIRTDGTATIDMVDRHRFGRLLRHAGERNGAGRCSVDAAGEGHADSIAPSRGKIGFPNIK